MAKKKVPVDTLLKELEECVGELPNDYKQFIRDGDFSRVPGEEGVSFDALEPTPFGGGVLEFFLDPDPQGMAYFEDAEMLAIGSNGFDYPTCISLGKADRGSIYYYDHQQRALWPDEQFRSMFSNLAPGIESYLAQRKAGTLPSKPEELTCFFKIANNFSEFLERCEPMPAEE